MDNVELFPNRRTADWMSAHQDQPWPIPEVPETVQLHAVGGNPVNPIAEVLAINVAARIIDMSHEPDLVALVELDEGLTPSNEKLTEKQLDLLEHELGLIGLRLHLQSEYLLDDDQGEAAEDKCRERVLSDRADEIRRKQRRLRAL